MNCYSPTLEPKEVQLLIERVSGLYKVKLAKLMSPLRDEKTARARHIICYMLKERGYSSLRMAKFVGRTASACRYSTRMVENWLELNETNRREYELLKGKVLDGLCDRD